MTYALRYAPEAARDMDAVWDGVYEASGSVTVADRYVSGLLDAIAQKKEFPFSGVPLVYRGLFTGMYVVPYRKYKAFYRVGERHIEVIRVLMAKRDHMTILFGEPEGDVG